MEFVRERVTGTVSAAMLFDMIIPGKGVTASGLLQLSLAVARTEKPAGEELPTVTEEFSGAYAACLQDASAEFNPVLDDEYVWFTLDDNGCLSQYWDSVIKHISDDRLSNFPGRNLWDFKKEIIQWVPWGILFPPWFDLQIPEIGETRFDGHTCQRNRVLGEEEAYDDTDPIPC